MELRIRPFGHRPQLEVLSIAIWTALPMEPAVVPIEVGHNVGYRSDPSTTIGGSTRCPSRNARILG